MKATDKQYIRSFYEEALDRYGVDYRSLHWTSERSQLARFDVLYDIGIDIGCSIMDVGCGLGDLYEYVKARTGVFTYAGYDISPKMVETAEKRFPETTFMVRDILESKPDPGSFDYVVASGTFNIRVREHDAFLRDMISVMYSACKKAVGFNLLERQPYDWYDDGLYFSATQEEVVSFCSTLSSITEVRTGYLPGDFTIFMYKEKPSKV